MGNDLATVKGGNQGLALNDLDSMWKWAGMVSQSGLAPDNLKTQQQIVVATQYGRELGLGPMTALSSICVVKGRPTIWGDAALAMVKMSPLLTSYSEKVTGVGDAMIAEVISEREGKFTVETTFSVDDAKTAGLWGKTGPWKTHPKRMLKYKARAFNLRDNFPDILKGLHLQEEMVGEVDEPLDAPTCDVAPRADRRKKVVSEQSPPPKDPAESATPVGSVGGEEDSIDEQMANIAAGRVIDVEAVDPGEAEQAVIEQTDDAFGDLLAAYDDAGGVNFQEWAAEALVLDEDEVDSAEKFTPVMIGRLQRHLESEGV